jgi:hypothetical protein
MRVVLLLAILTVGSVGTRLLGGGPDPIPAIAFAMDESAGRHAHPVPRGTSDVAPISRHPEREAVEWLHLMNYTPPLKPVEHPFICGAPR